MADQHPNEGSSSNFSGERADAILEINVKTLDSQIYSFQVDKNMPVSSFKEKIANDIGVPIGQQRLIYRGKVLKDEHLLSEYHVENGHTLHLVVRQPYQSQPASDAGSGETSGNNGNRGNGANANALRNRIGQISHNVLLGTFNVGDQGEGIAPDLSRVIGAVINSLGISGQSPSNGGNSSMQFSTLSNFPGQPSLGNEADGMHGSVGGQSRVGNQVQSRQAFSDQPFHSSPQVVPIPRTAAAVPVPSLHVPIPDSLNILSEFINRMEDVLTRNGYQPNTSSTSNEDIPRAELPSNERGLPTSEALSIVLRHAQRLLSGHAVTALSHVAGRLEQEAGSSDPTIRGQIQAESAQIGLAMRHLGSLLLELGRVILTLRMGQSPGESSINAGPAVYISPTGPNPIMVQPFPLQTSSLFGASVPSSNPMNAGPVGVGNAPRHINIHIHAGPALAPILSAVGTRSNNGDGVQGERGNNTGSADLAGSGSVRVVPVRNVIAATVPSRPTVAAQPGFGFAVSPRSVDAGEVMSTGQNLSSRPTAGNDAGNEQPSSMLVNRAGENSLSEPGAIPESDGQKPVPECDQVRNNEDMGSLLNSKDESSCSNSQISSNKESTVKSEDISGNAFGSREKQDLPEGAKAVPLGLGLGGLERKRQMRQSKTVVQSGDGETSNYPPDQNLNCTSLGQHLLQSLASSSSAMSSPDDPSSDQTPLVGGCPESKQSGKQDADGKLDSASAMSQVLHSPELNDLLSGCSEQTGVGSPDVLRNMLQQLTQSPQIMNTVNQIAQQIDTQDLGNGFSGLGSGRGGVVDLSRMVQQMMPIVSQALGHGSAPQHMERRATGVTNSGERNFQIGIQDVAQIIERCNPPEEVFRALVQNAGQLHGSESNPEDLVNELCSNEGLAHEYAKILRHDICQKLEGEGD